GPRGAALARDLDGRRRVRRLDLRPALPRTRLPDVVPRLAAHGRCPRTASRPRAPAQRRRGVTITAARAPWPFASTHSVWRPGRRARSTSSPGRAVPVRPRKRQRTRRASLRTRTPNRVPARAWIVVRPRVTNRTLTRIALLVAERFPARSVATTDTR